MSGHRVGRVRFVAGAVLLVLAGACASDAAIEIGAAPSAATPVATVAESTVVPTTEIVVEPLPTPTALVVGEPSALPTSAPTAAATPVPPTAVPPPAVSPPTESPTASPQTPAPAAVPATPAPVTDSQQVLVANGGEVFTLNCARCHGENGLGTQQYSAGLIGVGSQYSSAGMIAELTTGHPVTFGFGDRLSANEIASVVAYVKSVFP